MQNAEAGERKLLGSEGNAGLYPASWIDRFTAWVERLPGPSWTFYVVLWLVLYVIELAVLWTSGRAGTFYPFHVFFAGAISFNFGLIHYLDKRAEATLRRFRPMLDCGDGEYAELFYRLTTMPARPTLLATLFGIVAGGIGTLAIPLDLRINILHFNDSPASVLYNTVISWTIWACVTLLAYHTLHQLRVVSQIYGRASVNLFNLGPLYAFSDLSARTAIGLIAFVNAWYILTPELLNNPFSLGFGVFLGIVAVLTFVWPLLGIHNLLDDEKSRLQGETSKQLEATISELHRRNDSKEFAEMDGLHNSLESLEIEHVVLGRISTWPWHPETLRTVVATLLLPMAIWLTQWILQRVLGS